MPFGPAVATDGRTMRKTPTRSLRLINSPQDVPSASLMLICQDSLLSGPKAHDGRPCQLCLICPVRTFGANVGYPRNDLYPPINSRFSRLRRPSVANLVFTLHQAACIGARCDMA